MYAMSHQMLLLECTNRWLITFSIDRNVLGHLPESHRTPRSWEVPHCMCRHFKGSILCAKLHSVKSRRILGSAFQNSSALLFLCTYATEVQSRWATSWCSPGKTQYWEQEVQGGFISLTFTGCFEGRCQCCFLVPLKYYSAWNCTHRKSAWLIDSIFQIFKIV